MSEHRQTLMDHFTDPHHRGAMSEPDAIGRASIGGRPPFVTLYLKIAGSRVAHASFEAQGCGFTIACCSALILRVEDRPVGECRTLTPEVIIGDLGGLPETRKFCATLAVEALHDALKLTQVKGFLENYAGQ